MSSRYKTARCILFRDDRYLLAVHQRFFRTVSRRWGLPGGQIERGESAQAAAAREIEEELQIYLPTLIEVGAFTYKRAQHMVFAAGIEQDVHAFDQTELVAVRWFTEDEVAGLRSRDALHANYELEAIRRLRRHLDGDHGVRAAG